jgi:single-strand DNA-binding protein
VNINKVYLVGNLARDPEVRQTHSGKSVVRVLVVTTHDWFSREQNKRVRETDFIDVQAWGRPGELIAQTMKKGQAIFVEGRLKLDTWQSPEGEKRSKLVVNLESFQAIRHDAPGAPSAPVAGPPEGFVELPAETGSTKEGAPPAEGGPGASGKRRRRRRGRGPRREGAPGQPAGAPAAGAPTDGGTTPAATPSEGAAPTPPPLPPPPPPAPVAEPAHKAPDPTLKEDMPF